MVGLRKPAKPRPKAHHIPGLLVPPYKTSAMTISLLRPELPASVTPEESAELAARLHSLAKSGLSLEGGLLALAEEVGGGRLFGVLNRLAARLEKGEPLEKAIGAPDCRLPVVLRGLIVAGVRSGRLPDVLDQFAAMIHRQHNLRRA